jgi:hypothetical protein
MTTKKLGKKLFDFAFGPEPKTENKKKRFANYIISA